MKNVVNLWKPCGIRTWDLSVRALTIAGVYQFIKTKMTWTGTNLIKRTHFSHQSFRNSLNSLQEFRKIDGHLDYTRVLV